MQAVLALFLRKAIEAAYHIIREKVIQFESSPHAPSNSRGLRSWCQRILLR